MSLTDILDILPGQPGQLVQLGYIKIGGKSRQARQTKDNRTWYAPEKYDSFHLTTMNRDGTGHLIEDDKLMAELIDKCVDKDGKLRAIPIRLLSDDLDDVLQSSICWYGSKTVGARSDGKTITWYTNYDTGQPYPEPVVEPFDPEMFKWNLRGSALKVHSIFNCVIAAGESRWGGVYRFRTTSVISLKQLHASLVHLSQLTGGVLVGMPLMLCLRPIQVAPEGRATTVHVVHVELRGGDMKAIQSAALALSQFRLQFAGQIQKTSAQYRKLLAAPGMESGDEVAEVSAEFSPVEGEIVRPAAESRTAAMERATLERRLTGRPLSEGQTLDAATNQETPDQASQLANQENDDGTEDQGVGGDVGREIGSSEAGPMESVMRVDEATQDTSRNLDDPPAQAPAKVKVQEPGLKAWETRDGLKTAIEETALALGLPNNAPGNWMALHLPKWAACEKMKPAERRAAWLKFCAACNKEIP